MTIAVSILIPAYRAGATIAAALGSLRAQSRTDWEALVASDDGADYGWATAGDNRVRLVPPGPVRRGAGAARNRALELARGRFVCCLDADDTLPPDWLANMLAVAESRGAAFARTRVVAPDGGLVRVTPRQDTLGLEDHARCFAPVWPMVARSRASRFVGGIAEDFVWALQAIARLPGRRAPVAPAEYRLQLDPGSTVGVADASFEIRRNYADYARGIAEGAIPIEEGARREALDAIAIRAEVNDRFIAAGAGDSLAYHRFVAGIGI